MYRLRIVGLAVVAIVSVFAVQGVANAQFAPICRARRTVQLLYPFLDNSTEGANTALTITNTTNTIATPGSGTCAINFYSFGALNATFVTAPIAPGATYTNPVSALDAGFEGYAIANCCFAAANGVEFGTSSVTGTPTSFSYPAQATFVIRTGPF